MIYSLFKGTNLFWFCVTTENVSWLWLFSVLQSKPLQQQQDAKSVPRSQAVFDCKWGAVSSHRHGWQISCFFKDFPKQFSPSHLPSTCSRRRKFSGSINSNSAEFTRNLPRYSLMDLFLSSAVWFEHIDWCSLSKYLSIYLLAFFHSRSVRTQKDFQKLLFKFPIFKSIVMDISEGQPHFFYHLSPRKVMKIITHGIKNQLAFSSSAKFFIWFPSKYGDVSLKAIVKNKYNTWTQIRMWQQVLSGNFLRFFFFKHFICLIYKIDFFGVLTLYNGRWSW